MKWWNMIYNQKEHDPYDFGVVLADNVTDNCIPFNYKINTREVRSKLLAGIIDWSADFVDNCYVITSRPNFADDICYLCRSLGFSAYKEKKLLVFDEDYYEVVISGDFSNR